MTTYAIKSHERVVDCGLSIRVEGTVDEQNITADSAVEAVEKYLRQGDYSEGGDEREVCVEVDGEDFATYTAPEIRAL